MYVKPKLANLMGFTDITIANVFHHPVQVRSLYLHYISFVTEVLEQPESGTFLSKSTFFGKNTSGIPSECRRVWILIRLDVLGD